VNYKQTRCSGILGDLIECEWSVNTNRAGALVHPDGCADLVFDQSGRIYIFGITGKSRPLEQRFGGLLRGLRLKPGSIPFFFDVPASEFLNRATSLAELSSPTARALTALAKQADNPEELVEATVRLLSQASFSKPREQRLSFAMSHIDSRSLRSVASSLDITERQMHRLFLREAGISPSRLKRIRRLQRTIDALRLHPPGLSMASFALDQGFFDQAHMHHDLRDLTGMTPGALHSNVAQK
jgi:methylphosphotriester-DNA--protein-cysteine methyltransferase